jgi:hypothetical protein
MSDAEYTEDVPDHRCGNCKFEEYDSTEDESWCRHEPPPDGLVGRREVKPHGHCLYWVYRWS